jgi:uncharacterized protein (TIGR02145 family)
MKKNLTLLIIGILLISCGKETENSAPSITILSPNNGQQYKRGETIVLIVDVSDPDDNLWAVIINSYKHFFIDPLYYSSNDEYNLRGASPYTINIENDINTKDTGLRKLAITIEDKGGLKDEKILEYYMCADKPLVYLEQIAFTDDGNCSFLLNLLDDGGARITEYGICLNKKGNPTIDDRVFKYESSTIYVYEDKDNWVASNFSISALNLNPYQFYYARPYAKNSEGLIGLGNEVKLAVNISSGTFKDSRDGLVYKWVKLGNQTWMAENLAYLPKVNPGNQVSPDKAYYVYDYNGTSISSAKASNNYKTYGVLYDWHAAIISCPNGWHLPSANEWEQLAQFISNNNGGYLRYNDSHSNYLGYWDKIGTHLKTSTGWVDNGNGDDNYGFSALPGGISWQTYQEFTSIGKQSYFWTATEYLADYNKGIAYKIWGDRPFLLWNDDFKHSGFSIRCIKD